MKSSENNDTIKFTPAASISEAEEYAKGRFADTVSFTGAKNLDNVNEVNKTLTELTSEYPINTLDNLSTNSRLKSAYALSHGGKIEINTGYLNDPGTAIDWVERVSSYPEKIAERQAEIDSGEHPKYYTNWCRKVIKQMEEEMSYSRWSVSSSSETRLASTIVHEYGHVLADQLFGQIKESTFCSDYTDTADVRQLVRDTFSKAKNTGDIHNISMYASSNEYEFFAECFAAHHNGEQLPDYVENMLKEALKK